MPSTFEENERPSEWLRNLRERAAGYADLLREAGEPVRAAYRIARARCRTAETPATIPTLREVHAAVLELRRETAETTPAPSRALILETCEHVGLTLIRA